MQLDNLGTKYITYVFTIFNVIHTHNSRMSYVHVSKQERT